MRKAAALVLATLVLAGCGGDDETPTLTGSDESGRTAPTTTVPPAATVPPTTTVPPTRTTPPKTSTEAAAGAREALYCPSDKGGSAGKDTARFDARKLLGEPIADATALARRHGCSVRVVRRDGKDLIQTMDYSSARINVEERAGKVVALRGVA